MENSRDSEREKRIRKITEGEIEPGKELSEITSAQNEISDINSQLQNNLESEKASSQSRLNNNNILRQAAEVGLMGVGGGIVGQQVAKFNTPTKELLGRYGITPPSSKTSSTSTNSTIRSNTGGNTRIENTTNNNSRTEIKITQPQIPMQQTQVTQENGGNTARFKAWLSGVFAKQQNEYEIQQKEYRRREWSLNRSAGKMMRRMEMASKTFSEKMDPRNMGSTLGGQLKTLLFLFGTYMVAKVWKPAMGILTNIEAGVKAAFGIPLNTDLSKGGFKGTTFIDSIKKFIGIDTTTSAGKNTSLLDGIGKIFTQGIDRLIDRIDLFLKDRQTAIKSVKFPVDISTPELGWPFSGLLDGIKDTFGSASQYLGNLISAAFGGSAGMVSNAAGGIRKTAKSELEDTRRAGVKQYIGDRGLLEGGRKYMRQSDFDTFGNLRSGASSTLAMSQTVSSMINDKSSKMYTGAVATGLENLEGVANRTGQVVLDPNLLLQLGLNNSDISNLKISNKLKPVRYKFVKGGSPSDEELNSDAAYSTTKKGKEGTVISSTLAAGGELVKGNVIGAMTSVGAGVASAAGWDVINQGRERTIEKNYLKLVPINEPGEQVGEIQTLYALTKDGFNEIKSKLGTQDFDLKNKDFVDWVSKTLRTKKISQGITGPLISDQSFGEYNASQAILGQYNKNVNWLYDPKNKKYINVNTFQRNMGGAITSVGNFVSGGFSYAARKTREISGAEQKSRVMKAMNYFMAKHGLTKVQAAGLVGNLLRESGMKTDAVNPSGGAAGLAQWLGDRVSNFEQVIGKKIVDSTFDEQLKFISWELENTHKNGLAALKAATTPEEAAAAGFGYYEFSAGPEAGVRDMNRHGQDGIGSLNGGIQNAIDILYTYEKAEGLKPTRGTEINKLSSVGEGIAKGFDFISGAISTQSVSSKKGDADILKDKQTNFRNKFFKDMYGAKIDESGVYIDNKTSRVYLSPSSSSLTLDSNSVSAVVKVGKNGIIEPGDVTGRERDEIIAGTVSRVQDLLTTYKGKGTSADVLMEGGKPKWISLGRFTDTQGFDSRVTKAYKSLGGISYNILFSKDGKRIHQILTDSIVYPAAINGNSKVQTGSVLFKKGGFKTLTGDPIDWNPYFTSLGIRLTPTAKSALDRLRRLLSETLLIKDGRLYSKETGDLLNANDAKRYGIIDSNTGRIGKLKVDIDNLKVDLDTDRYINSLGINNLKGIQEEFTKDPDKFWVDKKDGNVYSKESGILIGSMKDNKFIPKSLQEIKSWLRYNPSMPSTIRDKVLKETTDLERGSKGLIGIDGISNIINSAYSSNLNTTNYNTWLGKQGGDNLILTQSIGGFNFLVKLNKDGSRVDSIKPELRKEGEVGYRLVNKDGSLGSKIITKDPGWISISNLKNHPELVKGILEGSDIMSGVGSLQVDLAKLITSGDRGSSITYNTQNRILDLNTDIKRLYKGETEIANSKDIQGIIKSSREKYLGGNTSDFITRDDGSVFTKEGILIGKLSKAGKLEEVSNKEVWEEMDKYYSDNKLEFYKKWFGAKEDMGELVVEDNGKRIVIDTTKPLSSDLTKVVKDVQWRVDKDSPWKSVSKSSSGLFSGFFNNGGDRSEIIKELNKKVSQRQANPELSELIDKNGGDYEKALQEQSELAYKNQETQEQILDNVETQTKAQLDIQTLIRAVADKSGVDLSNMKFSLSNDTLGMKFGNRTSIEGGIRNLKRTEETKVPLKPSTNQTNNVDASNYAPVNIKTENNYFGKFSSDDSKSIWGR